MQREYVAVLDGEGRCPDEIVKSVMATNRKTAERMLDPKREGLYLILTRRQAEARGTQDRRDTTRFCR
jgi:hypothetical protein